MKHHLLSGYKQPVSVDTGVLRLSPVWSFQTMAISFRKVLPILERRCSRHFHIALGLVSIVLRANRAR